MKLKRLSVLVLSGVVFSLLALLPNNAVSLSPVAFAQAAAPAQPQAAAEKGQAKTAPSGMNQGIQVSGHWTIDVRNPDGSLAKHVEFENALTSNAMSSYLPNILFGGTANLWGAVDPGSQLVPTGTLPITGVDAPVIGINSGVSTSYQEGYPYVFVEAGPWDSFGSSPPAMCAPTGPGAPPNGFGCALLVANSAAYYNCVFSTSSEGESPAACITGLAVTYPGNNTAATVLSGSFVVAANDTINSVASYVTYCLQNPGVSQQVSCPFTTSSNAGTTLYAATLDLTSYTGPPLPVQVAAGQTVNIRVSISFSSPASVGSNAVPALRKGPPAAKPAAAIRKP